MSNAIQRHIRCFSVRKPGAPATTMLVVVLVPSPSRSFLDEICRIISRLSHQLLLVGCYDKVYKNKCTNRRLGRIGCLILTTHQETAEMAHIDATGIWRGWVGKSVKQ